MENQTEEQQAPPPNACIACHNPNYEPAYAAKLCTECRNKFTKLRFPVWIQIFAGAVIALTVYGFVVSPAYFSDAVHLQRARKADEEKRFLTAMHEYEKLVARYPHKTDLKANLFHAYVMSSEYQKAIDLLPDLEGRNTEDLALAARTNADIERMMLVFGDSIASPEMNLGETDSAVIISLQRYTDSINPESQLALYMLADRLFDMKRFDESDKAASRLLAKNPEFPGILHLKAAIARETHHHDEGIQFYNRALEFNSEDIAAITGKARIEMKRKNDAKAAEYIAEAKAIDPENLSVLEAEILLAFLSGKTNEAKAMFGKLHPEKNSDDSIIYNRVEKYINGKEQYR